MNHLLPALHWLGTKPLTVSLLAQFVVIALAIKSKNKEQMLQSLILIAGLIMVITSINLRPPSPTLLLPDTLGAVAALFFVAPGVQALLKLRQRKNGSE